MAGGLLRRPHRLSLRARLLWTFLVPLAVVLVLVGVVATAALQRQLVSQVDSRLARRSTAAPAPRATPGRPAAGAPADTDGDADGGPDVLGARGQGAGTLAARSAGGRPRRPASSPRAATSRT